jgi:hypothetical protein
MAGKKKSSGVHMSWPRPNFATCVKSNKYFMANYRAALTYAHYEISSSDLKKETVKYLKNEDAKNPLVDKVLSIHENRFMVIGKYFYLKNHGADLPDGILEGVNKSLNDIINENFGKEIVEAVKEDKSAGPTIQDRLREKAGNVAGDIEGWIDDFFTDKKIAIKTVADFVQLFKSNDLKGPHMRHMETFFQRRRDEITAAVAGDKDILEGYANLSKVELKKYDQFLTNLFSACTMLNEVAKVERAPRKKKPVAIEKVVSKLKFKKEDNTLGIVSVSPTTVPGAKELWVYNTKTRKLAHYKSLDLDGFGVKGIGLLNFSAESAEKTLRKPADTLAEFKKASKVKLRTFLKDLTTIDTPATGKFNEHCVLLRVDK